MEVALIAAIKQNDVAAFEGLLDLGYEVNNPICLPQNLRDREYIEGNTLGHLVVEHGRLEMLRFLFARGADISVTNVFQYTLLHQVVSSHCLQDEQVRTSIVRYLLEHKIPIDARDKTGQTALHYAAMSNRIEVTELLLQSGANKGVRDNNDVTPFHRATAYEHLEIMRLLMNAGADINAPDYARNTPLHWAADKGLRKSVEWLCVQGAALVANQANETPLDSARKNVGQANLLRDQSMSNQYTFCVKLLENVQKQRQEQEAYIASCTKKQSQGYHYLLEQATLVEKLNELSEEDVVATMRQAILSSIERIGVSKLLFALGPLTRVLEEAKQPDEVIATKGTFTRKTISLKNLRKASRSIQDVKALLVEYPSLVEPLTTLQEYYEAVSKMTIPPIPGVCMRGMGLSRFLKDSAVCALRSKTDKQAYGSHDVIKLNDLFFKTKKEDALSSEEAPGVEYMVDCLNKLITGQGTPPSMLLTIALDNVYKPYMVSKGIDGMNLEALLQTRRDLIHTVANFSAMAIVGLLTKPTDNKADNFIATLTGNQTVERIILTCIDNDLSFGNAVVEQKRGAKAGKHFVTLKNVLYLFPQMDDPVDKDFRKRFLQVCPVLLILEWLEKLSKKNEEYLALKAQNVFTEQQLTDMSLPIKLSPNTVSKLYSDVCTLQALLKSNPLVTHQELLAAVEPLAGLYYRKQRQKYREDIITAYERVHVGEPYLELLINHEPPTEQEALRCALATCNQGIDDHKQRTQTIKEATEEFLESLDFSTLPNEALILFRLTKSRFLSRITIKNSRTLDYHSLPTLLEEFPDITQLCLIGCQGVKGPDLLAVLALYPKLALALDIDMPITVSEWSNIIAKARSCYVQAGDTLWDLKQSPTVSLQKLLQQSKYSEKLMHLFIGLGASVESRDPTGHSVRSLASSHADNRALLFLQNVT